MNIFQNAVELQKVLPKNRKFTLIGGCFDLIHVGHLHLLEHAASLEEVLVVAVLSDAYTRTYKGIQRPVINQDQRARMVASVRFVDFVYISDGSPSSVEALQLLKPDTVVFEEESGTTEKMQKRLSQIATSSPNTRVEFLPRYKKEEVSTGGIIRKIRSLPELGG